MNEVEDRVALKFRAIVDRLKCPWLDKRINILISQRFSKAAQDALHSQTVQNKCCERAARTMFFDDTRNYIHSKSRLLFRNPRF